MHNGMWVNNACGCVGLKVAVVIALFILMGVRIEFNYVKLSGGFIKS